jgi:hypothetical protein
MKELEPGHIYSVEEYDSLIYDFKQQLSFMKRIGKKFPNNIAPPHSGTNCQEVLRILIFRTQYLDNQKPCLANKLIIHNLRETIRLFENRALEEKNLPKVNWPLEIETIPSCKTCGHIYPHTCK